MAAKQVQPTISPPDPAGPQPKRFGRLLHLSPEHWSELLVTICVLGVLGWLAVTAVATERTLGGLQAELASTKERVARLAEAIPAVAAKLANRELTASPHLILVLTRPERAKEGLWQAALTIIDPTGKQSSLSTALLTGNAPHRITNQVASAVALTERSAPSLAELQDYATAYDSLATVLPSFVDLAHSYFLKRAGRAEIELAVQGFFGDTAITWTASSRRLRLISDWRTFAAALSADTVPYVLPLTQRRQP